MKKSGYVNCRRGTFISVVYINGISKTRKRNGIIVNWSTPPPHFSKNIFGSWKRQSWRMGVPYLPLLFWDKNMNPELSGGCWSRIWYPFRLISNPGTELEQKSKLIFHQNSYLWSKIESDTLNIIANKDSRSFSAFELVLDNTG